MSHDPFNGGVTPGARGITDASRQGNGLRKEQLEDWLDQALADTFPASDPVASPPKGTQAWTSDREREAQAERDSRLREPASPP